MFRDLLAQLIRMGTSAGANVIGKKLEIEAEERTLKIKEEAILTSVRALANQSTNTVVSPAAVSKPDPDKEAAVGRYIREKAPGLFDNIAEKAR